PDSSISQTASLPGFSQNFLSLPQSADYCHTNSDRFSKYADFKVREQLISMKSWSCICHHISVSMCNCMFCEGSLAISQF
ncbi:hypothetical protein XENORESO_004482, partial [Xenotaenia resolanae]